MTDSFCAGLTTWSGQRGREWARGNLNAASYNHYFPPNHKACDCLSGNVMGRISARSFHPGGVNVLFVDGHYLAIREYCKAHPNGPFSYSQWDSAIPRSEARPTHARWLKRYLPMVEEGTWAWLGLNKSRLFAAPLRDNVVASAFANREFYLVLANYNDTPAEVVTNDFYVWVDEPSVPGRKTWGLPGRSLHILRYQRVS